MALFAWRSKLYNRKPDAPELGDRRIVRKLILYPRALRKVSGIKLKPGKHYSQTSPNWVDYPITIHDTWETRWLGVEYVLQEFRERTDYLDGIETTTVGWRDRAWADLPICEKGSSI